jgi:hypothetical protein
MLLALLATLVLFGLVLLLILPKPKHKPKKLKGRIAGMTDEGLLFDEKELPPIPKNKLPISHTGQSFLPPGVPQTEMQLLRTPSYPSLRH